MQQFDFQNIIAVKCTIEWGQMMKVDLVATSNNRIFVGGGGFATNARKKRTQNLSRLQRDGCATYL